jgi:hypothetical protein
MPWISCAHPRSDRSAFQAMAALNHYLRDQGVADMYDTRRLIRLCEGPTQPGVGLPPGDGMRLLGYGPAQAVTGRPGRGRWDARNGSVERAD